MSGTFTKDNIPEIVSPPFYFQWEKAQNCYVVLYPEGMVKLSQSAGEIMKRCDGEKDISNIISELNEQFPGTDLESDVLQFLEVAHDNGWIRAK